MSLHKKSIDVFTNWDIEAFKNLFHEDFFLLRETQLLTLDEHIENIAKLVETTDWLKTAKRQVLIHENEYVYETRWEDGEDIVTNVILKKENDKIWRSIVNRMPKNR